MESDSERIEREIAAVIRILQEDYPKAVDYTVADEYEDGTTIFHILDEYGEVIATVDDDYITSLWNRMEGVRFLDLP